MSLFADRILATLSLCILGLLFWALAEPHPDGLWLLLFALATILILVPTYVLFVPGVSSKLGRFTKLLQRLSPNLFEKSSHLIQLSRRTGREVLLSSLVLSVVAHLVGIIAYWLIARSLDMTLSLLTIAWIRSGMMLATLLPITIAGLGVREVTVLILLQQYGIDTDIAIAFSMLVFATTVLGIGLLGGLTEAWRLVFTQTTRQLS